MDDRHLQTFGGERERERSADRTSNAPAIDDGPAPTLPGILVAEIEGAAA